MFLLQTSLVAERECQMAEPKLNVHSLAFSAFAVGVRLVNQLIHLVKLIAFVVKFASLGGHRKRHQNLRVLKRDALGFPDWEKK